MAHASPVMFGRYRLLQRLGAGGMGEVFRAEMLGPDGFARQVVVKRMLAELTLDADAVQSFIEEARLAARLIHPNIVQVHDFGKEAGRYYLVMEPVHGVDLARLLAFMAGQRTPLPVGASVPIISAVLDALDCVHGMRDEQGRPLGLVHRDVSPSNVLLGRAGEIKLTDFGIAKTRDRMTRTQAGMVKGKAPYMSPEQAAGHPLDTRSDLFSVGVMLFELCTGRRPFRGTSSMDVISKVAAADYPPPAQVAPHLGPNLCAVIERALMRDRDARFQTALEFKEALAIAAAEDGIPPYTKWLRSAVMSASEAFEEELRADASLSVPISVEGPAGDAAGARPSGTQALAAPALGQAGVGEGGASPGGHAGATAPTGQPIVLQPSTVQPGAGRGRLLTLVAAALAAVLVLGIGARLLFFSGPPKKVRVALRMFPLQRDWFHEKVFHAFEKREGCKVEIVELNNTSELVKVMDQGEADLVKVDVVHAPLLVERGLLQRLPELGRRVDQAGFGEVRRALRPEAVQIGTYTTITGRDLYLLPRKLETHILTYRRSLVQLAVARFPQHREALEAKLRALLGSGLPPDFGIAPDPGRWTYWDLLAAAWVWAREPIGGKRMPRYAIRPEQLIELVVRGGASATGALGPSRSLVDTLLLFALLRELGLLHPLTDEPESQRAWKLLGTGELAAYITNQIDVGMILGNGHGVPRLADNPADIASSPLPRRQSLDGFPPEANPDGTEVATLVSGWGWGVPRTAKEPALALKLALFILSRENHGAELEEFPILKVRSDVMPRWPLAKLLNTLGDLQLADNARTLRWPTKAGEAEAALGRLDAVYRAIVHERAYRGRPPVSRAAIQARVAREMAAGR